MEIGTNKLRGRTGLCQAIGYFGTNGYTISHPLNDTQWYDMIVEKDGVFQTVQCKFTDSKRGTIDLRETGGVNGGIYDHVFNHPVDLVFCADGEGNMFLIPTKDMLDQQVKYSIALRTEPNANSQGFETYKYLVHI